MIDPFFISDLHFGHTKILEFKKSDGSLVRPGFHSVEEMDMKMIENWNRVVAPKDKVYVVGDVAMDNKKLRYLGIMNGTKVLIKGNHDHANIREYLKYFKDIRGAYHLNLDGFRCIMTHVPIHPNSLARWGVNIHGHLHTCRVQICDDISGIEVDDPRYFNVSVEQIEYTPIRLSKIKEIIGDQR